MKKKFPKSYLHEHSSEAIEQRLQNKKFNNQIKDIIYGGSDGIVTTFAIVAGVSGAELSEVTVMILGLSNVLADGFSMAAGNYMGTKSEYDQKRLITEFEKDEIARNPEGEKEEVRQIFKKKGFEGKLLEEITNVIIDDRQLWRGVWNPRGFKKTFQSCLYHFYFFSTLWFNPAFTILI